MKLTPIEDRVIVKAVDAADMTSGGVILPDMDQQGSIIAKVIAVGPGRPSFAGDKIVPMVTKHSVFIQGLTLERSITPVPIVEKHSIHQKVHTWEKPYTGRKCDKRFCPAVKMCDSKSIKLEYGSLIERRWKSLKNPEAGLKRKPPKPKNNLNFSSPSLKLSTSLH